MQICKISIICPKCPRAVSSITQLFRTSPTVILVFQIKYAILGKVCKILIFRPKRPSTVSSITESPRTSSFNILVFWTKICKICKILILHPKTAQHYIKYHKVILNLSIRYFGVLDKSMRAPMRVYAKYPKLSVFAQKGPAPYQGSQSHLEPLHSIFRCFGQKICEFMRNMQFFTQNGTAPFQVSQSHLEPPNSIFWCFGQTKMQVNA